MHVFFLKKPVYKQPSTRQDCHLELFNPRFGKTGRMGKMLGSEIVTGIQSKSWDYFEIIGHE